MKNTKTLKSVLMSIKPKFVDKILSGEKRYEYRKKIWADKYDVAEVFIYSSNPVKKVVGSFQPGEIITGTPQEVWLKTALKGGITHTEFFDYFRGKDVAYAIEVWGVSTPKEPVPIENFDIKSPPQNFLFLNY